jgi:dethiobiotin synthetase
LSALFVTGSGTDIGKTFVMRALIRLLRAEGHRTAALKPVISGFDAHAPAASDSGELLEAQGLAVTAENIDSISPWRFRAPLAPDMAAHREGRSVEFDELLQFCRQARDADITLIEGVGGVMVPLDSRHTVVDWIRAIGSPALLVVGSYLGAISHALTAVRALQNAGIELAGVIVNASPNEPVPTAETAATVQGFCRGTRVVSLPRKKAGDPLTAPGLIELIAPYLERR